MTPEEIEAKRIKDEADAKKAAENAIDPAQFKQLVESVGVLAQGLKSTQQSISDLNDRTVVPGKDDEATPPTSEEDLDDMSRTDYANHIGNTIMGKVGEQLEKISEQITGVNTKVDRSDIINTVKQLSKDNVEFDDLKPETAAVAKRIPGISIEDAFTLAKAENPEKVKELEEKFQAESGDTEEKKAMFGGLTPTSGQSAKGINMSKQEAGNSAWDETMGALNMETVGEDANN